MVNIQKIQKKLKDSQLELITILTFLLLISLIPKPTFDWWSYITWAEYIRVHGLANVYSLLFVNYMPLNLFAIHIWQYMAGLLNVSLQEAVHGIKLYPILFDCLSILLALKVAKHFKFSRLLVFLFLLPNIAFHYNSLIWGQFDSVYTYFVLLSLYLSARKSFSLSAVAYLFALNAKLQAIIFLPVLLGYGMTVWLASKSEPKKLDTFLRLGATLCGLIIAQIALFWAFSAHTPAQILSFVWSRSTVLSSFVTFNADNFWILVGAKTMETADDKVWLMGLTYNAWGYILFFASSIYALLPIFLELLRLLKDKLTWIPLVKSEQVQPMSQEQLFRMGVLVLQIFSVNFFFFLTQMHERYSHPAVLFSAVTAAALRKPWVVVIVSLAYLINMERVNGYWFFTDQLRPMVRLDIISASLFAIAIVYSYWLLLKEYKRWD